MLFLVPAKRRNLNIDAALENAILYLEKVQSPAQGQVGEFAAYLWLLPDQSDKEYNFAVFTTPFVLHTLNQLALTHSNLSQVRTEAFEDMKSLAAAHLLNNMETLEGHAGVWRFYGPGDILPPDLDDTCCNLECLLSMNASLWGDRISDDLTAYFLKYRDEEGAFYTWMADPPFEVCAGVNANVLFFYASRNEEQTIQTAMDWLHGQISKMLLGQPYNAVHYRSPYAFTYFVSRAYADGGAQTFLNASQRESMRSYILADQEADGSWPTQYVGSEDELETALALVSLANLGSSELTSDELAKVEKGMEYLLNAQNLDGSWPCACFYLGALPDIHFGSNELTTAICMEALAKFSCCNFSFDLGYECSNEYLPSIHCIGKVAFMDQWYEFSLGRQVVHSYIRSKSFFCLFTCKCKKTEQKCFVSCESHSQL